MTVPLGFVYFLSNFFFYIIYFYSFIFVCLFFFFITIISFSFHVQNFDNRTYRTVGRYPRDAYKMISYPPTSYYYIIIIYICTESSQATNRRSSQFSTVPWIPYERYRFTGPETNNCFTLGRINNINSTSALRSVMLYFLRTGWKIPNPPLGVS